MLFHFKRGFTLIELLVSVFILTVGIVSTLLFFTGAMISTELARDTTVAATHGEYLLEEMQTRPSLSEIITTNWAAWAQNEGLNVLPDETFNIYFSDQFSNPLDVQATVSWTKKARTNNFTLKTKITK